jgi:hypothetical protein
LETVRHVAAIVRDVLISISLVLMLVTWLSVTSSLRDHLGQQPPSSSTWPAENDDCPTGHTAGAYTC